MAPDPDESLKTRANVRGIAIIVAVMAAWTVTFYLVTKVFWHLP